MKYLILTLLALIGLLVACKKGGLDNSCPAFNPVYGRYFVLQDHEGKYLLDSLADSVKITYTQNGTLKRIDTQVLVIDDTSGSTYKTSSYIGFYTHDLYYASLDNNIRNFQIYLNDSNIGTLHYDVQLSNPGNCVDFKTIALNGIDATGDPYTRKQTLFLRTN